ncbi:MAG TPA: acylneuraminate cytidylyltransferase [Cytophagales bacterium]|nr:acylneuraminate cytidylyltransferase [Cytophagales bacterium]HAA21562.1 acylneuraminate cytidylyltransferase [Cytophagales bacterium]HAP59043.1 acylneuraminate cytidylyltransferase [Cytophagales bacterium]
MSEAKQKVTALVPIKHESERFPNKNFQPFVDQPLYQVILRTLGTVPEIDEILVNTDSPIVMEGAAKLPKVRVMERQPSLLGNHITMNTIIAEDLKATQAEHFLQTHCTNPLLSKETIQRSIAEYYAALPDADSLYSVELLKKRLYDANNQAMNHRNDILLPTQDLPDVYMENSNLFLFSRNSFLTAGNSRIGRKPQPFKMHYIEGLDIDYEEDFHLAELVARNKERFPALRKKN